jgi:hypothetical protein
MGWRIVAALAFGVLLGGLSDSRDSCAMGKRDGGKGENSGKQPVLRVVQTIEVTDGSEKYKWPVWSPDGKRLAFTGPGFRGTYVRSADGTLP